MKAVAIAAAVRVMRKAATARSELTIAQKAAGPISGKRTCTQAQFPWRVIFAGIAKALRERTPGTYRLDTSAQDGCPPGTVQREVSDQWQFRLIADMLRPVCFQTGQCGFMAQFDRSCSIRGRVDAFASLRIPSSEWGKSEQETGGLISNLHPISDWEWAANPEAARS